MDERKSLGAWGEERTARFLRRKGYRILARNFRTRLGEIDLVALRRRVLCFVEVKTRPRGGGESAEASIGPVERRKLRQCAEIYLWTCRENYDECRFDAAIVLTDDMKRCDIDYKEDVF